jgi:hypothetical protein
MGVTPHVAAKAWEPSSSPRHKPFGNARWRKINTMIERQPSDELEQLEQSADLGHRQIDRLRKIEDEPNNVGPCWRPAALLRAKLEELQTGRLALRNGLLGKRWHVQVDSVRVVKRRTY